MLQKILKGNKLLSMNNENKELNQEENNLLERFKYFFSTFILFCLVKPSYYKKALHSSLETKGIAVNDYLNLSTTLRYILNNIPSKYLCLLKKKDPAFFFRCKRKTFCLKFLSLWMPFPFL